MRRTVMSKLQQMEYPANKSLLKVLWEEYHVRKSLHPLHVLFNPVARRNCMFLFSKLGRHLLQLVTPLHKVAPPSIWTVPIRYFTHKEIRMNRFKYFVKTRGYNTARGYGYRLPLSFMGHPETIKLRELNYLIEAYRDSDMPKTGKFWYQTFIDIEFTDLFSSGENHDKDTI